MVCMQLAMQRYKVKKTLSNNFRIIKNWFHENVMVLNVKEILLHVFRKQQSK